MELEIKFDVNLVPLHLRHIKSWFYRSCTNFPDPVSLSRAISGTSGLPVAPRLRWSPGIPYCVEKKLHLEITENSSLRRWKFHKEMPLCSDRVRETTAKRISAEINFRYYTHDYWTPTRQSTYQALSRLIVITSVIRREAGRNVFIHKTAETLSQEHVAGCLWLRGTIIKNLEKVTIVNSSIIYNLLWRVWDKISFIILRTTYLLMCVWARACARVCICVCVRVCGARACT